MERLSGKASHVRHSTKVTAQPVYFGDAASARLKTTYVTVFSLDGRAAEVALEKPVHIEEGDAVELVGTRRRDGVFAAVAYHNRSRGTTGSPEGLLTEQLAGFAFMVIGVALPALVYTVRPFFGFGLLGWLVVFATAAAMVGVGAMWARHIAARRREIAELLGPTRGHDSRLRPVGASPPE